MPETDAEQRGRIDRWMDENRERGEWKSPVPEAAESVGGVLNSHFQTNRGQLRIEDEEVAYSSMWTYSKGSVNLGVVADDDTEFSLQMTIEQARAWSKALDFAIELAEEGVNADVL